MDVLLSDLRARVILAQAAHRSLFIRGGGSKAFYGMPVTGATVIDMAPYQGVIDYQPSELVLTARAGTRLVDIEALLAANGQMLAFDPPHFAAGSTLGGCVATALAGPRRAAAGGVRDFVLGARLLDAHGRVLRFGGEVMKNVAGYDISRLLAGSLGTLGIILDVSIKVMPRPAYEASLVFELGEADALRRLNEWGGKPLPISASSWFADAGTSGRLAVRLSGSQPAIEATCRKLGGERLHDAASWWTALRDHTHPFLTARPLWRLSVPSTAAPLELGSTLVEWGGSQRWLCGDMPAQRLREAAARAGGHATLFRAASDSQAREVGVFHPLPSALAAIHKRLKNEFDPSGVFNPGRMYTGM